FSMLANVLFLQQGDARMPRNQGTPSHKSSTRNTKRNRPSRRSPSFRGSLQRIIERLEARQLLTVTLYIDYGDRFPTNVLTDTVGNMHAGNAATTVDGPDFTQSAVNTPGKTVEPA